MSDSLNKPETDHDTEIIDEEKPESLMNEENKNKNENIENEKDTPIGLNPQITDKNDEKPIILKQDTIIDEERAEEQLGSKPNPNGF